LKEDSSCKGRRIDYDETYLSIASMSCVENYWMQAIKRDAQLSFFEQIIHYESEFYFNLDWMLFRNADCRLPLDEQKSK